MSKKRVNLHLIDGAADGRIKVVINGWEGICFLIPRSMLSQCKEIPELTRSHVYFLLSDPDTAENCVYIGQASIRKTEKVLARVVEHDNSKEDYWSYAAVFVKNVEHFDQAELSFLENKMWKLAHDTARYDLKNSAEPILGYVNEDKADDLLDYIDNARLALKFLGFRVFEPLKDVQEQPGKPASTVLPNLPSTQIRSGDFVKETMKNLQASGFTFTPEQLQAAYSVEGSGKYTHRHLPLFWKLSEGQTSKDVEKSIRERYWAEVYTFGDERFLLFSQWYPDGNRSRPQKKEFIEWYSTLKE